MNNEDKKKSITISEISFADLVPYFRIPALPPNHINFLPEHRESDLIDLFGQVIEEEAKDGRDFFNPTVE